MVRDTGTFLVEQYRNLRPSFRVRVLNTSALVVGGPAAAEMMAGNTGEVKARKVWEGMIREFGWRQVLRAAPDAGVPVLAWTVDHGRIAGHVTAQAIHGLTSDNLEVLQSLCDPAHGRPASLSPLMARTGAVSGQGEDQHRPGERRQDEYRTHTTSLPTPSGI